MGHSKACLSSGREEEMRASVSKGFKSERNRQTEGELRERERERERQRESWGGRQREGGAVPKVPQGFLQNSTVLMRRYSESDHAALLDKRCL